MCRCGTKKTRKMCRCGTKKTRKMCHCGIKCVDELTGHTFKHTHIFMTNKTVPELKKPSGVIHVDHVLTAPAQRLYNCLLAYIQEDIPNVEEMPYFQVPTEVIRGYLHTRNDAKIKEWLRELRRKDVEFNNIRKGGPSWGCYGFIESPEIKGSYIRFGIAPTLRDLMSNSTMFSKINMLLERKFKKTKHALPLYELGLDYRDNKDPMTGKGCTPWMEIKVFRKYMGIQDHEYKDKGFGPLNRDVIQKALKEIKAESDIIMSLDKDTEQRQVKRIRFLIEDNKANMSATEKIKRLQATLPMEGSEGSAGAEISHFVQIMTQIYAVHVPRAKKAARRYVGYKDDFTRICHLIDQKKLAGECKGSFGAWAAKIFEAEAPMLKHIK